MASKGRGQTKLTVSCYQPLSVFLKVEWLTSKQCMLRHCLSTLELVKCLGLLRSMLTVNSHRIRSVLCYFNSPQYFFVSTCLSIFCACLVYILFFFCFCFCFCFFFLHLGCNMRVTVTCRRPRESLPVWMRGKIVPS